MTRISEELTALQRGQFFESKMPSITSAFWILVRRWWTCSEPRLSRNLLKLLIKNGNLGDPIVKYHWCSQMIAKFPFQNHAILILFITKIQHQDKSSDREHTGCEEKHCPSEERNPDDQGERDQLGPQAEPVPHEFRQHTNMVEIRSKSSPLDHVFKLDNTLVTE